MYKSGIFVGGVYGGSVGQLGPVVRRHGKLVGVERPQLSPTGVC